MSAQAARVSLDVLRIIARLNMGGPARHVVLLDRGLRARGHRTRLIYGSLDEGEASLEHLALDEHIPAQKIPDLGRRISPLGDARALGRLLALLFRETPDVVHTHTAKAGALGRIAALVFNITRGRSRRCLVVHTFHGHVLHGYFGPAAERLVRFVERSLARVTDRIVTISPAQHYDISERFHIAPPSKVVTIPLGLHLDLLLGLGPQAPSYRQSLAIPPGDVVIGYVGRMVPIKALPMLVTAFVEAVRQRPDIWLLLVGDGPARGELEAMVAGAGIGARVRFTGWSEDLPRVYATMDICALSSLNEGTPVAIIEALAAGRAVAATSVGGVPDLINDGTNGLLIPPGDAPALATAILRLTDDAQLRRRFGEAGRRLVAARYASDRLVTDVERLYLSALAGKRRNTKPDDAAPEGHGILDS